MLDNLNKKPLLSIEERKDIILKDTSLIHLDAFYISIKIFCRIILYSLGIFPKINGSFPKSGTYIIMMNHSSFVDIFLYPLVPKRRFTGITAIENFKIPILSYLLKRINAIPIERKNKRSAIRSIEKAEKVLKSGVHIGILPEGSRSLSGKLAPLKKGGFHMAVNTQTNIIPVGVVGAYLFKPKNRWWLRPNRININIGSPIKVTNYNSSNLNDLLLETEKALKYLSKETNEY